MDRERILDPDATLAQAVAAREQLLEEALGVFNAPTRPPTLADYCESWMKRRSKRVRRKTAESYASRLGLHLLPYLGEVRLDELERRHLVWWRDALQDKIGEAALATVRSWWRDGLIVIRDALAEYELRDCTRRLEPPAGDSTRRRPPLALSREQVAQLLAACGGRYASAVRFLARTGARAGEMRGLRWMDLDLSAGVAHIRQSITWVAGEREVQITPPKGKRARLVPLTPDLVEALREHLDACPGVGEALVWSADGVPLRPNAIARTLDAAVRRLGWDGESGPRRITPQNLRQTVNSLGPASGVDPVVLRSMVGHQSEAMTLHYHGLRPEVAQEAARKMWGLDEVGVGVGGVGAGTPSTSGQTGSRGAGSRIPNP